jgi:crossover junction endodeoxyribonuclease RusA
MDLKFRTPWPPSVNNYWKLARGRFYINKPGIAYRETVRDIVFGLNLDRQMTGRLSLAAELHAPDNRRRDIDNVLKAMLDAIQKSDLIDDDNQFDELIVQRGTVAAPEGYVDLTIVELDSRPSVPGYAWKGSVLSPTLAV